MIVNETLLTPEWQIWKYPCPEGS